MKTEIKIHKVGDCYEITENGSTRQLTGDFTIEMVGAEAVIQFNGEEHNSFDGWVACSDRLPEDGLPVWVNSEHGVTTAHWCERAYEQYFIVRTETDPGLIARHPTHWHPLPSPPPMKKDPE